MQALYLLRSRLLACPGTFRAEERLKDEIAHLKESMLIRSSLLPLNIRRNPGARSSTVLVSAKSKAGYGTLCGVSVRKPRPFPALAKG